MKEYFPVIQKISKFGLVEVKFDVDKLKIGESDLPDIIDWLELSVEARDPDNIFEFTWEPIKITDNVLTI